jgi:hypothetical protein
MLSDVNMKGRFAQGCAVRNAEPTKWSEQRAGTNVAPFKCCNNMFKDIDQFQKKKMSDFPPPLLFVDVIAMVQYRQRKLKTWLTLL